MKILSKRLKDRRYVGLKEIQLRKIQSDIFTLYKGSYSVLR